MVEREKGGDGDADVVEEIEIGEVGVDEESTESMIVMNSGNNEWGDSDKEDDCAGDGFEREERLDSEAKMGMNNNTENEGESGIYHEWGVKTET